jgi:hypothetical protein
MLCRWPSQTQAQCSMLIQIPLTSSIESHWQKFASGRLAKVMPIPMKACIPATRLAFENVEIGMQWVTQIRYVIGRDG